MPFGNVTTLYLPTAANAGASQWGTDVRKVLDVADGASDGTSRTNHGTSTGSSVRTVDPYTTTTTDDVQANFGWAIAPADMNSVEGAKRFMLAGDHVATVRLGHNGATGATGTLFVYVYRVGPAPGRTRTLLGSSSATFVLPITSGEVTASVTVALGEVIFEVDETLQYSFEVSCAGIALTGRIVTFFTGTQTVACRVDIPKLGVLADTTGAATGQGSATGTTGKVLAMAGSAVGTGTASGVLSATGATIGTAGGSSTASAQASSVAGAIGTAAGSGSATGLMSIVLGTVGTVTLGGGGEAPVTPEDIAAIANAVWDELTSEARTSDSYGALVVARLDAAVSSRATSVSVAALGSPAQASDLSTLQGLVDDLEARLTAARAALLDNLDVAVSTRATPGDVAPVPEGVVQ